jgi:hypothetical protein
MFKYEYSINVQIHIQMHSDIAIHIQHSCANTHTDALMFKYTYSIHVQVHIQMHSCSNTHTDALMFKYMHRCIHV